MTHIIYVFCWRQSTVYNQTQKLLQPLLERYPKTCQGDIFVIYISSQETVIGLTRIYLIKIIELYKTYLLHVMQGFATKSKIFVICKLNKLSIFIEDKEACIINAIQNQKQICEELQIGKPYHLKNPNHNKYLVEKSLVLDKKIF